MPRCIPFPNACTPNACTRPSSPHLALPLPLTSPLTLPLPLSSPLLIPLTPRLPPRSPPPRATPLPPLCASSPPPSSELQLPPYPLPIPLPLRHAPLALLRPCLPPLPSSPRLAKLTRMHEIVVEDVPLPSGDVARDAGGSWGAGNGRAIGFVTLSSCARSLRCSRPACWLTKWTRYSSFVAKTTYRRARHLGSRHKRCFSRKCASRSVYSRKNSTSCLPCTPRCAPAPRVPRRPRPLALPPIHPPPATAPSSLSGDELRTRSHRWHE